MSSSKSHSASSSKEPASPHAASQPQTLGGMLTAAREKIGLSLEEAARILRLRPAVLRELENDDLRSFDHASYARMTLLGYARILRLPEDAIRPWLPQATGFETSESNYLHRLAHSEETLRDQRKFETAPRSGHPLRSTLKVFLALVLILGIGYGYVLWRNLGRLQPGASTPAAGVPTPTPSFTETLENVIPSASPATFWKEDGIALDIHASPLGTPVPDEEKNYAEAFIDDGLALDLPMALPVLQALPVESSENPENPSGEATTTEDENAAEAAEAAEATEATESPEPTPAP